MWCKTIFLFQISLFRYAWKREITKRIWFTNGTYCSCSHWICVHNGAGVWIPYIFFLYDRNTNMCTHSQLECTEYSISLPFTFDLFHHWIGRASHTAIDVLSFCTASAHIVAKYYLIRVNIEYVRQHYANAKFNANIGYVDDVLFLAVIATHHQYSLWYFVWRLFAIEMSCE